MNPQAEWLDENRADLLSMDSEIADILEECVYSTKAIAQHFFPERFYAEFAPKIHDPIFELIDSGEPKVVIAAPRGIGKTSIVGLALTARKILFQLSRFLVYVSSSFDSAQLQTENLKIELITNRLVRKLFGHIKHSSAKEEGLDEAFSKKAWVANSGSHRTLVFPRGSGQPIRGLLYRNDRPDLIVVDDLEDSDTITSQDIRHKRKEWFNADLLKATSRMKKGWQIVYIDTLKHEDSLLESLLGSEGWASIRLSICDDDYKSNAPTFITDEELATEVAYHKEQGILDVFAREFRNMPIARETAAFKQEYFRDFDLHDLEGKELMYVVIVDPAKTVGGNRAAESAVLGVGLDFVHSKIYVRDVVARQMYPDELYNEIILMATNLNAVAVGLEVTSLNEFIIQPFKNAMAMQNKFFNIIQLNPRGGSKDENSKVQRIAALIPYYRQGMIYHNRACCTKLEEQLMGYPRSKRWDVMDCLAYVVEMMEIGEQYFFSSDMDSPSHDEDVDKYFAQLSEADPEPLDGWRVI